MYDEIAAGGMATVHLGRLVGPGGFGRIVAVKRLHAQFQKDPQFLAMLLDEARIASRIYHPNVVQMLDVVTDQGIVLVLEYVNGESLWRLAHGIHQRDERIEPAIASAIVVGMLHGLHAAHETRDEDGVPLGLVHRDVSPQNVIVGVDGTARLLDFGIAKASGRIQQTRDGQLKGKLAYMAPEQLRSEPVDRRADVWASSVVLWELLTGARLFAADDEGATVTKILFDPIPSARSLRPALPSAVDEVVARGLERDPALRWPTANEMAEALEAAMPAATRSRVAAWVEREWQGAARRAALLADIEAGRAPESGEVHSNRESESTASAVVVQSTPREPSQEESADTVLQVRQPRPVLRLWWVAAVLLVGGVTTLAMRQWRAASPAPTPSAQAAQSIPPPTAPPEPSGTAATASASAAASIALVESASASAKRPPVPPTKKSAKPVVKTPECDPPYTLDPAGNHVWKRECFK